MELTKMAWNAFGSIWQSVMFDCPLKIILLHYLKQCPQIWMNKWMSKQMNEQTNEWNEWTNK